MPARTYVPQLRRFLVTMNKYLARYTPLLLEHLDDEQVAQLLVFQLAMTALITLLGPEEEGP